VSLIAQDQPILAQTAVPLGRRVIAHRGSPVLCRCAISMVRRISSPGSDFTNRPLCGHLWPGSIGVPRVSTCPGRDWLCGLPVYSSASGISATSRCSPRGQTGSRRASERWAALRPGGPMITVGKASGVSANRATVRGSYLPLGSDQVNWLLLNWSGWSAEALMTSTVGPSGSCSYFRQRLALVEARSPTQADGSGCRDLLVEVGRQPVDHHDGDGDIEE
jgi:hypothetical protein